MSNIVSFQEFDKHVLITMDDGKANAVSPVLLDGLNAALDQAERCGKPVVLTGRAGKFSAGFDLSVMGQGGLAMAKLVSGGAKLAHRLLGFPLPVVVACTGHGLAMGAFLLLAADYRVGADGPFKIGLNEVAIGMVMPHFGVEIARYRLNPAFFGRAVSNAEVFAPVAAVEAGYLDRVTTADNLLADAVQVATGMAALNMSVHHATKLRVRGPMLQALLEGLERDFGKDFV